MSKTLLGPGGRGAAESDQNSSNVELAGNDNAQGDATADDEELANKIAETMSYGKDEDVGNDEPRRRRRRRRGGSRGDSSNVESNDGDSGHTDNQDKVSENLNNQDAAEQTTGSAAAEKREPVVAHAALPAEPTEMGSQVKAVEPQFQEESQEQKPELLINPPVEVNEAAAATPLAHTTPSEPVASTAPVATTETEQQIEPVQETQAQAEPVTAVETQPSEPAHVDAIEERAEEPKLDSEPVKPVAASSMSKASLTDMLDKAGMLWVETDHEKWTVVQKELAEAPKPARPVRERKPVVKIEVDNLVLVETKPEYRGVRS